MRYPLIVWTAFLALSSGCQDDVGLGGQAPGDADPGGPGEPVPLCIGGGPLESGDAPWVKAPFEPPGDMGMGEGEGEDDEAGGGFLQEPDGGGVSFECDLWAQDCPPGEKCMPWANDGGSVWNATRCSPIADDPAGVSETCMAEGSPVSGIDDCGLAQLCWDVNRDNHGSCVAMCEGNPDEPSCPGDQWCLTGRDGVPAVCLPPQVCADDGVCQCLCPEGVDPNCEVGQCEAADAEREPPPPAPERLPPVHAEGDEPICPDDQAPLLLYMSNDDSNSQASPILARRTIAEGRVFPRQLVRIHEFLNYFDLNAEPQQEVPAKVGMELRRTNASDAEFTLVLRAQGRMLSPDDRPPMNLVFSLDTSGSMAGEPMELLQEGMVAIVGQLRAGDVVSIVTWNDAQAVEIEGYAVPGPNDAGLLALVSGLHAGGSTNLHDGLVTAYAIANAHHMEGGINRVVLISDGGANAGITDLDLIASEAADADGEGTYMIGVGVGTSQDYRDDLMDAITDAGKGAYIYVDRLDEASKQLGERFLANAAVSARNVRMQLTLPWYFGVKRFHGEEISTNPAEVEPQHLAPNDTMTFHQVISACDPALITTCDPITARVDYVDPITGVAGNHTMTASLESLVAAEVPRLYKADVAVGYAKSLVVISHLHDLGESDRAVEVAVAMQQWALQAAEDLHDEEVLEIASIMGDYAIVLAGS